jgi:dipeptidyl aminopeptidase/acylaminoacyl peptidase
VIDHVAPRAAVAAEGIVPESDDMVAAIEANGGIVEYVIFEDEGHGFRKNDNRIEGWNAILAFLDTYLAGAPAH